MAVHDAVAHNAKRAAAGLKIRPERYPFFDKLLFAVFVLAVPPFIAGYWSVFRDGDVSWHVAAGRWILEHGRIPTTDPFSFTMPGHPWIAHEWLAEVIYALGYDVAGHAGLAAVVSLAVSALFATVFIHLRSRVGPTAMLIAFAVLFVVLKPFVMARPHVIAWALFAGWTAVLVNCRDKGRAPLWPLVGIMFLWANVHASFIMGLVVAAAIALDACNAARWSRPVVLRWFLFGLASLAAALLNANGIAGFVYPFMTSSMESLRSIGEWSPSTPRATPLFYWIVLLGLGGIMLKRPRFSIGEVLLLLVTLGLAFTHIRHQAMFIILAVLFVTPKLAGEGRAAAPPLFSSISGRRAAAIAAVAIAGMRAAVPLEPRETFSNPRGLIAHIPAELRKQPVFNGYSMGGPLILAGVPVFIDGRADMYGDAFFSNYMKIAGGDAAAFDEAVNRYGIRWTMLGNDVRLAQVLDSSPEWQRLYADDVGVIHVRRAPAGLPPRGRNLTGNNR